MFAYLTVEQLNKAGVTYDAALPQPLFNEISQRTGQNPFGLIVMLYQDGDSFGCPCAVTPEGAALMSLTYGREHAA